MIFRPKHRLLSEDGGDGGYGASIAASGTYGGDGGYLAGSGLQSTYGGANSNPANVSVSSADQTTPASPSSGAPVAAPTDLNGMFNPASPAEKQIQGSLNTLFAGAPTPGQSDPSQDKYNNLMGNLTATSLPGLDPTLAKNMDFTRPGGPSLAENLGASYGPYQSMVSSPLHGDASFNAETPAMRDARMGAFQTVAGNTVGGLASMALNPIERLGMAGYNAYQGYQSNPSEGLGTAAAQVGAGVGGLAGALSNGFLGNYGGALTGAMRLTGSTPTDAMMGGVGLNAAMGKDVGANLGTLSGYYAGQQSGGPVGGVVGSNVGRTLGGLFGGK